MPSYVLSIVFFFRSETAVYTSQHSAQTAVPRASHGASHAMALLWPKKNRVFAAFSWHSTCPRAVDVAKGMMALQSTKRQSAVNLESVVWLPGGVQLTWLAPMQLPRGACVAHAALGRDTRGARRHS